MAKPQVLVLGSNFAGLGAAQKIREYARDSVDITVLDRKPYLLFVPNIPYEVFEGRNPMLSLHMPLVDALAEDDIHFILGEVQSLDPEAQTVEYLPSERIGSAVERLHYDYVVVAVGARLAYDKIEGFAEYGHTVSDTYYGEKLRRYLAHAYRGGPVAIGSARFHQGTMSQEYVPTADAACEGPPVEVMLSFGHWLKSHGLGGPEKITVFTPGRVIAEDAGESIVDKLLSIAGSMGYHYLNQTEDIRRITEEGIEFANGQSVEAELKIIFPDWEAHAFLKGLPISDDQGFVLTDMATRNPRFPNVFACGDAAAVTVPKLGILAHMGADKVGQQIASDLGRFDKAKANEPMHFIVNCIGDMGGNQAFAIRSDTWYGGTQASLKMGHIPFLMKMQYKEMFFRTKGKVPDWGIPAADFLIHQLG
jgi:sulfide:quinone oxidoreductase